MSKRNRKNLITLLALLLILALFIGLYIWNKGRNKDELDQESQDQIEDTDNSILLSSLDKDLINRIHIINEHMEVTLILDEDTWKDEVDPLRPINQVNVLNMVNLVEEVRALRLINENPEDLGEYGLKDPSIQVEVQQTDGKALQLQIGHSAITSDGYYSLVGNDGVVYLLDNSFASFFGYTAEEMMAVETGPVFDFQNIYYIEILKRDGYSH